MVHGLLFRNPDLGPMELSIQLGLIYKLWTHVRILIFNVNLRGYRHLFISCANFKYLQMPPQGCVSDKSTGNIGEAMHP